MLNSMGYTSYSSPAASLSTEIARPGGWWALGLMRIATGIFWYTLLLWKSPPHFGGATSGCSTNMHAVGLGGLCDWLHKQANAPLNANVSVHVWSASISHTFATSAYADFVRNTVIPHFTLFGSIIFGVETFITVSLVLGLFTRVGGVVSALWSLLLLLGLWSVGEPWWWMPAALGLIFFATRAGRYYGLDGPLSQSSDFFAALG